MHGNVEYEEAPWGRTSLLPETTAVLGPSPFTLQRTADTEKAEEAGLMGLGDLSPGLWSRVRSASLTLPHIPSDGYTAPGSCKEGWLVFYLRCLVLFFKGACNPCSCPSVGPSDPASALQSVATGPAPRLRRSLAATPTGNTQGHLGP